MMDDDGKENGSYYLGFRFQGIWVVPKSKVTFWYPYIIGAII